jgi:hypothetical protein
MTIEDVRSTYEPKILALLSGLQLRLLAVGVEAESPYFDNAPPEYTWRLEVAPFSGVFACVVTVEIIESAVTEGEGDGINFDLTVEGDGGVELERIAPFNYTPECWVSAADPVEVERRWVLFWSSVDIDRVARRIEEFLA